MYKKTLLSLAVASTLGLTGCFQDSSDSANAGASPSPAPTEAEQGTYPIFNPVTSELPLPNDLIFDSEAGDGSFSVDIGPSDEGNPVLEALNKLSGASTVAPAVVRFNDKIDEESVDARSVIPDGEGDFIPNPEQNVFLLELEYASGDPVRGLSNSEPPTVTGQASFETDLVELDDTSALRILPTEPLDPLKRHIVVVTNEVMTAGDNPEPIKASPSYSRLTQDGEDAEVEGALAGAQTLVNDLWEPSAIGYIDAANNQTRETNLTVDDFALTYSFTTSDDEKVLSYVGDPGRWLEDQVRRSTKISAIKKVTGAAKFFAGDELSVENWDLNDDGSVNAEDFDRNDDGEITPQDFLIAGNEEFGFADTSQAAEEAVTAFDPNALGVSDCGQETGDDKFVCTGDKLEEQLSQATSGFPTPTDQNLTVSGSADVPYTAASGTDYMIRFHQGSIELPYYLGVPEDGPTPIRSQSWSVDHGLAGEIAQATGFEIPQADEDQSDVINYNFPFPKAEETIRVPVLIATPDSVDSSTLEDGAAGLDQLVMFQHGITADRSAAVGFSQSLIGEAEDQETQNVGVIAIDQPLHGIDPDGPTIPTASSFISPVFEGQGLNESGATERHFGYESDASGNADNPQAMDFEEDAVGGSGSLFINLSNFIVGRDNLRQGSVDLMNVRKTVQEWDNVDSTNTFFVGHSLGTLNGGAFVGAANRTEDDALKVAASHLMNPANGVAGLLQNSPSFAPRIFGGLKQSGLEAGDADLETYTNVNQHALDSADVVNFAGDVGDVLITQVDGDLTTPNAAVDDDSVTVTDNSDIQGNPTLEIPAYPAGDGTTFEIRGQESPLAGSEQLARLVGLSNITRYSEGVHTTAIAPAKAEVERGDIYRSNGQWIVAQEDGEVTLVTEANARATFSAIIGETIGLITP